MKITVAIELNDANELGGLSQFVKEVEAYRNPAKAVASMAQAAPLPPSDPTGATDGTGVPTPPEVIATITPQGVVKGPKQDELNQAALSYAEKHGLPKALELVRQYGVSKVSELKDPAKMAALLQQFQEGLK